MEKCLNCGRILSAHSKFCGVDCQNKFEGKRKYNKSVEIKTMEDLTGKRVILLANEEEGWPEERGVVDGYSEDKSMVIITVDKKYRDEDDADGLREVIVEMVEKVILEK
jgi:hypothetical protein